LFSIKILSPGRANESRLTPPPRSPTTNSNQSFDGLSTSATSITSDMKRSIVKELSLQVSPVEDHENKTDSLGAQRQVNI
jgi:hypothetical protein